MPNAPTSRHTSQTSTPRSGPKAPPKPDGDASPAAIREVTEVRRAVIETVSPEGRPGDPNFGVKELGIMMVSIVVFLLIAALVLALLTQSVLAIAIGIIAILLFVANPQVWAAMARTRERQRLTAETRRSQASKA